MCVLDSMKQERIETHEIHTQIHAIRSNDSIVQVIDTIDNATIQSSSHHGLNSLNPSSTPSTFFVSFPTLSIFSLNPHDVFVQILKLV
ncbi:hypothetical protein EYC84_006752 [Monilinia fructicola]|uniref:Uncharacterized protein n=1 Tax=Monilinia fructicola TaxID=38448 RepID=A0A5M9K6X1_MONFR|nr:hypothetical protein EYC84_006752 [Monilinia fructicola]